MMMKKLVMAIVLLGVGMPLMAQQVENPIVADSVILQENGNVDINFDFDFDVDERPKLPYQLFDAANNNIGVYGLGDVLATRFPGQPTVSTFIREDFKEGSVELGEQVKICHTNSKGQISRCSHVVTVQERMPIALHCQINGHQKSYRATGTLVLTQYNQTTLTATHNDHGEFIWDDPFNATGILFDRSLKGVLSIDSVHLDESVTLLCHLRFNYPRFEGHIVSSALFLRQPQEETQKMWIQNSDDGYFTFSNVRGDKSIVVILHLYGINSGIDISNNDSGEKQ